jgi:hypothetical protein
MGGVGKSVGRAGASDDRSTDRRAVLAGCQGMARPTLCSAQRCSCSTGWSRKAMDDEWTKKTPGIVIRTNKSGECAFYWRASAALIRQGFRPKVVRLHGAPEVMLEHAMRLRAQMLEWGAWRGPTGAYDGTLRSLVSLYERQPESPYRDLRHTTQTTYSKHMKLLVAAKGDRRIDALTGSDIRRWYKEIAREGTRQSYAYLTIGILKSVVSYGASEGYADCARLREAMSATRFSNGPARTTRMTYVQVVAFRGAAHAVGRASMALGVTLQFECALRQRDVIGEWIDDGTRDGRWQNGLTWSHIGPDGILRKKTSKTGAPAEHRIADHPDLAAELARVPINRRVGPLVVDDVRRVPYTPESYRRWFRTIARRAGIPDAVWNMDARAGAVTEAWESGAEPQAIMAMATHTQLSTSRRYNRSNIEQISRAAQLRVKGRKDDGNG